jgi:hypothetical protein
MGGGIRTLHTNASPNACAWMDINKNDSSLAHFVYSASRGSSGFALYFGMA